MFAAAQDTTVLVSMIGGASLIIVALIGAIGARINRNIEAAHAEVRTNHGLRAGDYIEQIGPLVEWAIQHTVDDNAFQDRTDAHLARVQASLAQGTKGA